MADLVPPRDPDDQPPGRLGLTRFVRDIGSFVRLAHTQGTRLVDVLERWVEAAEEHNRHVARMADAAQRLADHADAQLGTDYEEDDYASDPPDPA